MATKTSAAAGNGKAAAAKKRAPKSASVHETPGAEERAAEALNLLETRGTPSVPGGGVGTASARFALPKLDIRNLELTVVGDSELICHRWSEKARRIMLEKQMGRATAGKEKKDPVADFLGSLYTLEPGEVCGDESLDTRDDDGHPRVWVEGGTFGVPAGAFKDAAVTACTSLGKDITKVAARQAFHVLGELAVIELPPGARGPRMREDMVRLNGTTSDIRHRGAFPQWRTKIRVRYNARVLSDEQVINLMNTAGFAVGVCEWRAEKNGNFGMFHIG